MHLYEDENRSVGGFYAVDVEIDGLLQHGHAVDVPDGEEPLQHVLVDFGCATQEPVLVKYGKIYECSEDLVNQFTMEWHMKPHGNSGPSGADVDVLLREHPDQPWKWYPGKILRCIWLGKYGPFYAVVEAVLTGFCVREFLPWKQIRMQGVRGRKLPLGHFCTEVTNGQKYLTTAAAQKDIMVKQKYYESDPVHMSMATARYVNSRRLVTDLRKMSRFHAARTLNRVNDIVEAEDVGSNSLGGTRKKLKPNPKMDSGECCLTKTVELLKEIFLSMDSLNRTRCRRVCFLWDEIIRSPQLCADIRVGFFPLRESRQKGWSSQSMYAVYCSMLKLFSPFVRTICVEKFYHCKRGEYPFYKPRSELPFDPEPELRCLLKNFVDDACVKIDRYILHRRRQIIQVRDHVVPEWFDQMAKSYAGFASSCKRIIWVNCSMDFIGLAEVPRLLMKSHFRCASFNLNSIDTLAFWDQFENNLCNEPANFELVLQSMVQGIGSQSKDYCQQMAEILTKYQSCDPRPSANYPDRKWETNDLAHLEVKKLNKLCSYILSCHM